MLKTLRNMEALAAVSYRASRGANFTKFREPKLLRTVKPGQPVLEWIDLESYSPGMRDLIKGRQYHSIYVVSPGADGPIKIGISGTVWKRLPSIQNGSWEELRVYRLFWVPRLEMARRMEALLHTVHGNSRLKGEWFDLPVSKAANLIMDLREKHFPADWIKTHQQMMCWLPEMMRGEK